MYSTTVSLFLVIRPPNISDIVPDICDNKHTDIALYIQICILRVALDKPSSWGNLIAHQHGENLIGLYRLLDIHLQDRPLGRVHCRLPERLGVHLAEALVATN